MINRLKEAEWIEARPYQAIFSPEGRRIAEASRRQHQIVVEFLTAIGIRRIARADAEGIEHHVSEETLAFENFLKSI